MIAVPPIVKFTAKPAFKLPVRVTVNIPTGGPDSEVVGVVASMVTVGNGGLIVKVAGAESPPPGLGSNTLTSAVPGLAMKLEGIEASSIELLTNVVIRSWPFQRITNDDTKLPPKAASVKPGPPAFALDGDRP